MTSEGMEHILDACGASKNHTGGRSVADAATVLQDLGLPYSYDPNPNLAKVLSAIQRTGRPAIVGQIRDNSGHVLTVYGTDGGRVAYGDSRDPGHIWFARPEDFAPRVNAGALLPH